MKHLLKPWHRELLTIIFLFMVDVSCIMLIYEPLVQSLLCFFCIKLFRNRPWSELGVVAFFIALYGLITTGRFGLSLVYLLPFAILVKEGQKLLYPHTWYPYVLVTLAIIIEQCLLLPFTLDIPCNIFYTNRIIYVNLMVLWGMSLKYNR